MQWVLILTLAEKVVCALLCFRRRFKFYDWKEPAILDWRIPSKEASERNLERPNDSEHFLRRLDILYVLSSLKKPCSLVFDAKKHLFWSVPHSTRFSKLSGDTNARVTTEAFKTQTYDTSRSLLKWNVPVPSFDFYGRRQKIPGRFKKRIWVRADGFAWLKNGTNDRSLKRNSKEKSRRHPLSASRIPVALRQSRCLLVRGYVKGS